MAHVPLFWVIAVGLVLVVGLVGGGLARMREQRRHVRGMLRDTFDEGGRATVHNSGPPVIHLRPNGEGPNARTHFRAQKPPSKSSLYHRKPLRSQVALSSSWV
jgi:hypothetical protein